MAQRDTTPQSSELEFSDSRRYAKYVVAVLFLVAAFNIVDRYLFGLLIEPIKAEFGLSDSLMGLLAGFAFSVFNTVAGIPVARLADRSIRRTIIAWGLFFWSFMAAGCGLAQNVWQLTLARIGVGIGEAAGSPPSHSLLSDYFPPEKRGAALGFVSMGGSVGLLMAMIAGGWIAEHYGWRTAFIAAGLPGIALAIVVRLTVREPPRGRFDAASALEPASTTESLRYLFSLKAYRHLVAAGSLHSFAGIGAATWNAVFLMRVHDMSISEAGFTLAILNALFSSVGIPCAGILADHLGRRDVRWYQWVPAGGALLHVPFALLFLLWPDPTVSIFFLAPGAFFGGAWAAPGHAMAQGLAKPPMRALSSAVMLLLLNLIGLGLGPMAVGILNDTLDPTFGAASVRYSLLLIAVTSVWGAVHNLLAAKHLPADLRRAGRGD
jgi:MFS family permease